MAQVMQQVETIIETCPDERMMLLYLETLDQCFH